MCAGMVANHTGESKKASLGQPSIPEFLKTENLTGNGPETSCFLKLSSWHCFPIVSSKEFEPPGSKTRFLLVEYSGIVEYQQPTVAKHFMSHECPISLHQNSEIIETNSKKQVKCYSFGRVKR